MSSSNAIVSCNDGRAGSKKSDGKTTGIEVENVPLQMRQNVTVARALLHDRDQLCRASLSPNFAGLANFVAASQLGIENNRPSGG